MKANSPGSPPRALIYTRVSTGGQTENTSLAGQYEACKRKAAEMGAAIMGVFEETKSGGLYLTRGQLQKALSAIESGEANILILSKLDRTGREVDSLRDIRRRVENAGAQLIFADGMNFEKSAVGNLMFTQLAGFAEFEREMIRERMTAGQERTALSGKQPSTARSPYGFKVWQKAHATRGECGVDEVGTYAVIEEQAKWVKLIFEHVANYESLRAVCAWLTESGAISQSGRPWSPASVRNIILNQIYKGKPAWRKTRSVTDESRAAQGVGISFESPRPESEWVFLRPIPALVDEDLWQRANDIMERGRAERSGRTDHKYLLSGLLFCSLCGRRISALAMTRTTPTIKYHAYRCSGRHKRQTHSEVRCSSPAFGGPATDKATIEAIIDFLANPEMMTQPQRDYEEGRRAQLSDKTDLNRIRHLRKEIENCAKKEDIAAAKEIDAAMNGSDGSTFERLRIEFTEKRRGYEIELEGLERAQMAPAQVPVIPKTIRETIAMHLQDESISDARKGLLMRQIVKAIHPIDLPEELRINARALREKRDVMDTPRNRRLGGVYIVLQTGPGPVHILTRQIVGNERYQDASGRKNAMRPIWETSFRIEAESPFAPPPSTIRPSNVLTKELRRQKMGQL